MTIKQHLEETYNNSFKKRKSDAVKIEGEQKTQTKNNSIKKINKTKSTPPPQKKTTKKEKEKTNNISKQSPNSKKKKKKKKNKNKNQNNKKEEQINKQTYKQTNNPKQKY